MNARDKDGRSALMQAEKKGYARIVQMLREAGAETIDTLKNAME